MGGEVRWTRSIGTIPKGAESKGKSDFARIGKVAFPIITLLGAVLIGIGAHTHGTGGAAAIIGGGTLAFSGIVGSILAWNVDEGEEDEDYSPSTEMTREELKERGKLLGGLVQDPEGSDDEDSIMLD